MRKATLLSLVLLMVLASCGPVTPVSSTLPPATPTRVISIPTASPSSTPLPSIGESNNALSYRLREWDERSFRGLMAEINTLAEDNAKVPSFMAPDYKIVFDKEFLLRFPESDSRDEILRDILFNEPETTFIPGLQVEDDLMGSMITELLERGVQLDGLQGEIEKIGLIVDNAIFIGNLTGDGKNGLVLIMKTPGWDGKVSIYTVFSNGGDYQTINIWDWENSPDIRMDIYFDLYDVGDTNANGIPEFIARRREGFKGIVGEEGETLHHFEWFPQNEEFQKTSFPVFIQSCIYTGACESDWEFSREGSHSRLVAHSYLVTHEGCPNLVVERISFWDGNQYIPGAPEIVPPDDNLSPECRLAWATAILFQPVWRWVDNTMEVAWENDLAISILDQSLQNWPVAADEWWGPASRDFFKLRLGIWYELRSESDKATIWLKQVASQPVDSKFDFASRLASLYLQQRETIGITRACRGVRNAFVNESEKVGDPGYIMNESRMIESWGFIWQGGILCDEYEMLPADVMSSQLLSSEMLDSWLTTTAYKIRFNDLMDLNNDGLEDRLVVFSITDGDTFVVWAFIMTKDGYVAKLVKVFWNAAEHEIIILPLETTNRKSVFLVSLEPEVVVFRVLPDLRIETQVDEYGVQSYMVFNQPASTRISIHIDNKSDESRTEAYFWSELSQRFEKQDDFRIAQATIEELFYVDRKYSLAINEVDHFLLIAPPEPVVPYSCGGENCEYLLDWYIPYFRYMRALAYEQLGLTDQARDEYYSLWQDFPKNVFGVVAGKKLKPAQP